MEKKELLGVTIFSWIYRILGTLGIFYSIFNFVMVSFIRVSAPKFTTKSFKMPLDPFIITLLILSICILLFIIGYRLSKYKENARKWAIYFSIFYIIGGLINCFTAGPSADIILIAVFVVSAIYLTCIKVNGQFK